MARTFGQMVAEAMAAVPVISPAEANRRMQQDPNTLFVDVRDAADIPATGIIPDAANISLGSLTYRADDEVPEASVMHWFDAQGEPMTEARWTDPEQRTLQYVATSTPAHEPGNRVLLVIHGREDDAEVVLPAVGSASSFLALWSSADERPLENGARFAPGDRLAVSGPTLLLLRAE